LQPPPPTEVHNAGPIRKGTPTWIWILVGVIVVCGCGGAGVLGAVLVPVFLQARNSALRAQCLSNVKRASLAQVMYATDADDHFPAASKWIDLTTKYVPRNVFDCPAVVRKGGSFGYASNVRVSGKALAEIPDPVSTILLFETSHLARNANGDPATDAAPNRHGLGRVLSYTDGHTRWLRGSVSK
jgi:hypothetical protein